MSPDYIEHLQHGPRGPFSLRNSFSNNEVALSPIDTPIGSFSSLPGAFTRASRSPAPVGSPWLSPNDFSTAPSMSSFDVVASASHDTLFKSGNKAYLHLYDHYKLFEGQNQVLRESVASLTQTIQQSLSTVPAAPGSVTSSLIPLAPFPQLSKDDYPNVKFWDASDLKEFKDANKENKTGSHQKAVKKGRPAAGDHSTENTKVPFFEDEYGEPVSVSRVADARQFARNIFNGLLAKGAAPSRWSNATFEATLTFWNGMYSQFPELRFCSSNWKANWLATDLYSHWAERNGLAVKKEEEIPASIPSGKRLRAASGGKRKKAKHNDEDKKDKSPSDSTNTAAAAGPDIIITDHADTRIDATATVTIPSQAGHPSIGPTSIAGPVTRDTVPPIHFPVPPASSLVAENLSNTTMASTAVDLSQDTVVTVSPTTSSLPALGDAIDVTNTHLTQSPPTIAGNNPTGVPEAPTNFGRPGLKAPVVVDPFASDSESSVPVHRLSHLNETASTQQGQPGPSGGSVGIPKAKSQPKKGTSALYQPQPSVFTARNLYGQQYQATHPGVTHAEYTEVWKSVDDATKKKYDSQARELKKKHKRPEAAATLEAEELAPLFEAEGGP